jgi:acetyl esterase/lipase
MRCIYEGIRVPDALALSYPATYLNTSPSPARLISMVDPMVNFTFLQMCSEAYIDKNGIGQDGELNPFISPALIPDEILKKFPPTYINIGTLDPLFDDGIHIAKRINNFNGGRVKLDIYDGLAHGYLNLVDLVPEGLLASTRLSGWINKFLQEELKIEKSDIKKKSGLFSSSHSDDTEIK